ncbi:MAG: hypothetical protein LBK63_01380 [Treponema sp.]|jgi:hypothetical protein|nr:hypothetical protein [Treponema sp.]
MKKLVFAALFAALCGMLSAQNSGAAAIAGTWQNDREQQRFVFGADGTVVMSAYGEALEKAMREEQNAGGGAAGDEAWTEGLKGTYAVKGNSIELAFQEGRKTHKMTLRIVNANTLRMYGMNYARVTDGEQ